MRPLLDKLRNSPAAVRVVPFAAFVLLTSCQGQFGEASRYWVYLAKTLLGAWFIWAIYPAVLEMRWRVSPLAVVTGIGVFGIWVGLDSLYPKYLSGSAWNPHKEFGEASALAWFFVAVRILGSTLVVPPLEEVFFRSFVYRSLAKSNFLEEPLGRFAWLPFLATSCLFGLQHREWLAGILCGFAYQGLVIHTKRLGDAMTAHAITNLLLGLWVVARGAWQFW